MEYKADRVYKAVVNNAGGVYRIYFMFCNDPVLGKVVGIGKGIHTGPEWTYYHIGTATEVRHPCPEGTWVITFYPVCDPTWRLYPKTGSWWTPTISLENEEPETRAQRVWREIQEGDVHGTSVTPAERAKAEVMGTVEWYKKQQAKERRDDRIDAAIYGINLQTAGRRRQGIITSIKEKEVKKKMLQLIDVIFFNRKTKVVDYRKEIVAVDTEEAYMLAAQDYGKYNSKVHIRNAVCMFSFVEDGED